MPVRRRETGQVREKGIVMFMFSKCVNVSVCVSVICLVLVGLIFHQRMFDVRSKMGPEEKVKREIG